MFVGICVTNLLVISLLIGLTTLYTALVGCNPDSPDCSLLDNSDKAEYLNLISNCRDSVQCRKEIKNAMCPKRICVEEGATNDY